MTTGRKHSRQPGLTLLRRSRTTVPGSPDNARLELFKNPAVSRNYIIRFDCPEFTSLCPVTGQPDFGHIVIEYTPRNLCIESKSLKLYLMSFRNSGAFHEEVVNRILDEVVKAARPRNARISGEFRPRGGISITVEACYPGGRRGRPASASAGT